MKYVRIILTYALAAVFLFASVMKFSGSSMEVAAFQKIGLGLWFMYFTAAWELLAVILTITKKYRVIGLLLIVLVCIGSFVAQVAFLKEDWIHTVVLGAIAAYLAWYEYRSH